MGTGTQRTVGEVARISGVTVRTLHHYDATGLVRPSGRTAGGYRLYGDADLAALHQVLLFRELGLPLAEIRRVMADPGFDRLSALREQRELLALRAERTRAMMDAIDKSIDAIEKGTTMDEKDMFEVFGDFDPAQYEDEVKERWGESDAYKESARRTKGYTKEDWLRLKAESEEITLAIADAMDRGLPPDSAEAMDAVEAHRLQIDRWFYPCSREMQVGLGEMYVADPRFTATYEKVRPGMAAYVRDAIRANAARAKGE